MPEALLPRSRRQPLSRSEVMSRIRSRDTRPERWTKECLRLNEIRYRTHVADLPGKPDFANKTRNFAIFVQGCFWHSHEGCGLASRPKSNKEYWGPKLKRNRERDAVNYAALERLGFRILVVWECETRRDGASAAKAASDFFCNV